jgi:hypothetical protein
MGRPIRYLFGTLPGLLIVVVAWDALIVASLSLFSGPVRSLGLAELVGVDLSDTLRVGRIIMLYHSLAIPFVAALVYLILDQVPMGSPDDETGLALWRARGRAANGLALDQAHGLRRSIVVPVTAGYMLTSLGGMTFAYSAPASEGRNWLAHGVYLVGLSLAFYAGVLLAIALWPSKRWATNPTRYAHLVGIPLERLAFFLVAVFTLVSVMIGGAAGAFFGNGFVAFLAEDVVRQDPHNILQLMIIAHLHIMLTLIDVMILLLVIRAYRVRGRVHRIAVPLTIVGTIIVTFANWSVIGWEGAHNVINVGSAFLLPGAILVAVWGFSALSRQRMGTGPAGLGPQAPCCAGGSCPVRRLFRVDLCQRCGHGARRLRGLQLGDLPLTNLPGSGADDPGGTLAHSGNPIGCHRPLSHRRPAGHRGLGAPSRRLGSVGRIDAVFRLCECLHVPPAGRDQGLDRALFRAGHYSEPAGRGGLCRRAVGQHAQERALNAP